MPRKLSYIVCDSDSDTNSKEPQPNKRVRRLVLHQGEPTVAPQNAQDAMVKLVLDFGKLILQLVLVLLVLGLLLRVAFPFYTLWGEVF